MHFRKISIAKHFKGCQNGGVVASSSSGGRIGIDPPSVHEHNVFSSLLSTDLGIRRKIALIREAIQAARSFDPRIHQVQASYPMKRSTFLLLRMDDMFGCQPLVD
jgi:hypothetical protein